MFELLRPNGYGKCSKILNTSCLPKRSRQTLQTQIRLLLKISGLIRVFPVCYKFVNSSHENQHFIKWEQKKKCVWILEHLPYVCLPYKPSLVDFVINTISIKQSAVFPNFVSSCISNILSLFRSFITTDVVVLCGTSLSTSTVINLYTCVDPESFVRGGSKFDNVFIPTLF